MGVKQSAGEPLGAEHLDPVLKGQIGGDDEAGALVSTADHVEEQFGTGLGKRGTKTYAAFKAGEEPPVFDPEGAVVADLVVGWKLEKVAVRINKRQGLVENFKNANVAFLVDVPERKIRYR